MVIRLKNILNITNVKNTPASKEQVYFSNNNQSTPVGLLRPSFKHNSSESPLQESLAKRDLLEDLFLKRPFESVDIRRQFETIIDYVSRCKSDTKFNVLSKLLYLPNNPYQIPISELVTVIYSFTEKELENAEKRHLFDDYISKIEKRNKLSLVNYRALSRMKDENWKEVEKYNLLRDFSPSSNLSLNDINNFLSQPEEVKNKVIELMSDNNRPVSYYDALELSDLTEAEFERIKALYYSKFMNWNIQQFDLYVDWNTYMDVGLLCLAAKGESCQLEVLKKLFTLLENGISTNSQVNSVSEIVRNENLSKTALKRKLFDEDGPFSENLELKYKVILANYSDEDFEKLLKIKNLLLNLKNTIKSEYETILEIPDFINLPGKEFQKINADEKLQLKFQRFLIQTFSPSVLKFVDVDLIKHASKSSDATYNNFLNDLGKLSSLDTALADKFKEKLNLMTYPEQKLEQIRVLATLILPDSPKIAANNVSKSFYYNCMEQYIDNITPTNATNEQLEKAKQILSDRTHSNNENIEIFIEKMSVPQNRQNKIRAFLTPPSLEYQIQTIDKKIFEVENSKDISDSKKKLILGNLRNEKSFILNNPEEAERFKLTKLNLNRLAAQIESHINIPVLQKTLYDLTKKLLYDSLGLNVSDELIKGLDFDEKYFPFLLTDKLISFKESFFVLMYILNSAPGQPLSELREHLTENMNTKKLFEKNGINYKKWSKYDPDLKSKFVINNSDANKKTELIIRLADMDDVSRNLFFGNHVGCCASIGSSMSYSSPSNLINSFVRGLEVVDKDNNTVGNTLCYFIKYTPEGSTKSQLGFVLDNFIFNGEYQYNPELTEAVYKFAKKVATEMGCPKAEIILGSTTFNKIDLSNFIEKKINNLSIIGDYNFDKVYLDVFKAKPKDTYPNKYVFTHI